MRIKESAEEKANSQWAIDNENTGRENIMCNLKEREIFKFDGIFTHTKMTKGPSMSVKTRRKSLHSNIFRLQMLKTPFVVFDNSNTTSASRRISDNSTRGLKFWAKMEYNGCFVLGDGRLGVKAKGFADLLKKRGYDFVACVPCTWVKDVIDELQGRPDIAYVAATSEAAAVGMAAGAYLGGKTPAVLMQNNGLANCMDVVSSLIQLYRIPLLMVITWRGYRGDDFEEHLAIGKATRKLLKSFDIPVFAPENETVGQHLKVASFTSKMSRGPAALLVRKGVLE